MLLPGHPGQGRVQMHDGQPGATAPGANRSPTEPSGSLVEQWLPVAGLGDRAAPSESPGEQLLPAAGRCDGAGPSTSPGEQLLLAASPGNGAGPSTSPGEQLLPAAGRGDGASEPEKFQDLKVSRLQSSSHLLGSAFPPPNSQKKLNDHKLSPTFSAQSCALLATAPKLLKNTHSAILRTFDRV